jgi:hypothetical protein
MLVQGRCSFVRLMAWVDLDLQYKRRVLLGKTGKFGKTDETKTKKIRKLGKTGSSFVWCGFLCLSRAACRA